MVSEGQYSEGEKIGRRAAIWGGISMESWAEKLRRAGLKATRSRVRLLEVLQAIGGHHSADEIHRLLKDWGCPMARGSVFKMVSDLWRANLLMVTDLGTGRSLYELHLGRHHHFVCRGCRSIWDVPEGGEEPTLQGPEFDLPGKLEQVQVVFRGLCRQCLHLSLPSSGVEAPWLDP